MISLGLLFAARFKSEEMVSGLLNFITWPMMFLSGVWFSLEGMHPILKQLAQLLPLTHMINAMRAIMLDGAGFADILMPVSILAAMSFVFILVGSFLFKWE
jgi:ABC-2 type transport system permease protein